MGRRTKPAILTFVLCLCSLAEAFAASRTTFAAAEQKREESVVCVECIMGNNGYIMWVE